MARIAPKNTRSTFMAQNQTFTDSRGRAYSGAAIGFIVFAGVLMIMIGVFQIIGGLVALLNDEFFVVTQQWIFQFDLTAWGWIHLILGVLVFLAGVGLFSGRMWARSVAVILAVASAVANFAFLPWYPLWSLIMIALSVFVIWAVTAHGRDLSRA
jgi:Fe2+ transport system protein B